MTVDIIHDRNFSRLLTRFSRAGWFLRGDFDQKTHLVDLPEQMVFGSFDDVEEVEHGRCIQRMLVVELQRPFGQRPKQLPGCSDEPLIAVAFPGRVPGPDSFSHFRPVPNSEPEPDTRVRLALDSTGQNFDSVGDIGSHNLAYNTASFRTIRRR